MYINISQFPVFVKIGCYEGERLAGQEILVSLKAEAELPRVSSNPLLDPNILNYEKLLCTIDEVLKDQEIQLIEYAVESLGRMLLSKFSQLKSVEVHIEKPLIPAGINRGAKISVLHTFIQAEAS